MTNKDRGTWAEKKALTYLSAHGLQLVTRNYHSRCGEIDLIMQDKAYLVFIEVRMRTSINFGGALDSISHAKKQKLIKTALYYLLTHQLSNQATRFDIFCLQGKELTITWIKNAFGLDF